MQSNKFFKVSVILNLVAHIEASSLLNHNLYEHSSTPATILKCMLLKASLLHLLTKYRCQNPGMHVSCQ